MGLITFLGFKAKVRPHKYENARYAIRNVSKKDLSKIIRELEKFENLPYEKKRTKYEPTDSYFYLARQLAKCIMRADALNWHCYGSYTQMTAPSLTFVLRTRKNQNSSSCTKFYRRVVPRTRTNKNKASSTNFIAELFRGRGQIMFNGGRQIIMHYYGTKRSRECGYIQCA